MIWNPFKFFRYVFDMLSYPQIENLFQPILGKFVKVFRNRYFQFFINILFLTLFFAGVRHPQLIFSSLSFRIFFLFFGVFLIFFWGGDILKDYISSKVLSRLILCVAACLFSFIFIVFT